MNEPSAPSHGKAPRRHGRSGQIILAVLTFVALAIAAELALGAWRTRGPDQGFARITGIELPAGIMVMGHATRMTDNFFHQSHFWLLDGSRGDFRALAAAAGLDRSDEDAKSGLRDDLFDGKAPEFLEGYEGSLDGGRDRWLFVLYPGDRAIFEY